MVEQQPAPDTLDDEPAPPPASSARRRLLGRAGPVALIATALPVTGSLAVLAAGPLLAPWLRKQGPGAAVGFTIAFALLGAVALAPTYSTSFLAGWAFGFAVGFPSVVIGTVVGATLCYLMADRTAGQRVHSVFEEHPKWDVVRRALAEERPLKTLWIVFLMRLSPVLPFGTTNVLMATTGVPLSLYVVGTMLGLMPRMGLVALAAAKAETFDFDSAHSWWMLAAGLAATGVCIVVLAVIGKHALERATLSSAPVQNPNTQ
jgi:uncharacterized membrane protein YdjX (TVP38/TMEM64 family)